MISGNVTFEDIHIVFSINPHANEARYQVEDLHTKKLETHVVPQAKFLKALAILVHNDGTPDYKADYSDAESIMQPNGIRWIP